MATRLPAERSGVRFPVGVRNCSPKILGRLRVLSSLLFNAFGVISRLYSGRGVKTIHIHLSSGLRMGRAIPLLPLHSVGRENFTSSLPIYKLSGVVFNRLKPSGYCRSIICNTQKFYVLPTRRIYVFSVNLRTNNDYFPVQH